MPAAPVIELSSYVVKPLRNDDNFTLYRGRSRYDASQILVLSPLVVNELHKVLVPPRGLFASGKFDQYQREIPYATLAQAFQSLVRPLLGKPYPTGRFF
jgi:hypothetical protein